jgi:hypothetical protein
MRPWRLLPPHAEASPEWLRSVTECDQGCLGRMQLRHRYLPLWSSGSRSMLPHCLLRWRSPFSGGRTHSFLCRTLTTSLGIGRRLRQACRSLRVCLQAAFPGYRSTLTPASSSPAASAPPPLAELQGKSSGGDSGRHSWSIAAGALSAAGRPCPGAVAAMTGSRRRSGSRQPVGRTSSQTSAITAWSRGSPLSRSRRVRPGCRGPRGPEGPRDGPVDRLHESPGA